MKALSIICVSSGLLSALNTKTGIFGGMGGISCQVVMLKVLSLRKNKSPVTEMKNFSRIFVFQTFNSDLNVIYRAS